MEIGNFELFTTKAEEARTERDYIDAVRDYWITRTELERAVGGNLNPRQSADDKSLPVSNPRPTRPAKSN
jgi:cobalt-zinc-cadmium efflux system outer membrane protein